MNKMNIILEVFIICNKKFIKFFFQINLYYIII